MQLSLTKLKYTGTAAPSSWDLVLKSSNQNTWEALCNQSDMVEFAATNDASERYQFVRGVFFFYRTTSKVISTQVALNSGETRAQLAWNISCQLAVLSLAASLAKFCNLRWKILGDFASKTCEGRRL